MRRSLVAPILAPIVACAAAALAACSHGGGTPDLAVADDAGVADLSSAADLASACPRTPRADDAQRTILVAHPYTASGDQAMDFEALTLDAAGTIARPGQHVTMGRAPSGTFAFTADGAFGFVAQDDGSIGVVALHDGAAPTVVEAAHKDTPYAAAVWVGPAGDHLYVVDSDTEANGGGIFDLPIACDGRLGAATKLSAADVPYALVSLPAGDWGLYARGLAGAGAGQAVHRVALGPPLVRTASAVAFTTASDETIIGSSTRTHDGKWLLFGDDSQFSGVDNRVAAVALTAGGLGATQVVTPENDPVALVASPFDDLVLVVSGFDDALRTLAYDPSNATAPFSAQGTITYMGAKPELPGGAVLVERGALRGTVYVAENLGIRPVRFTGGGHVTDLGKYALGSGTENIVGAIGVTP